MSTFKFSNLFQKFVPRFSRTSSPLGQPAAATAHATILEVRETNFPMGETEIPVILKLRVSAKGLSPYVTEAKTVVSWMKPRAFAPGMDVTVHYFPREPHKVEIEHPEKMSVSWARA